MKVFVAADLEGCAGITTWDEIYPTHPEYVKAAEEMTREVCAVCETLVEAGAEVTVKDSHFQGKNIDYAKLPESVRMVRMHGGTPDAMVQGIDQTYDAAMFIGFHSGASMTGNPLSHTMNRKLTKMMINGMTASEYLLHAYVAASYGVPVIFVSGDKMLCDWIHDFNPAVTTATIKESCGAGVQTMSSAGACALLRQQVRAALQNGSECRLDLPETFRVEMQYKEIADAAIAAYYPGVQRIDSNTVGFTAHSIRELMTTRMFIQG